jgi:hypothetical protein
MKAYRVNMSVFYYKFGRSGYRMRCRSNRLVSSFFSISPTDAPPKKARGVNMLLQIQPFDLFLFWYLARQPVGPRKARRVNTPRFTTSLKGLGLGCATDLALWFLPFPVSLAR